MFYGANVKNYWTIVNLIHDIQEYCAWKNYVVLVSMLNLKAGKFGNLWCFNNYVSEFFFRKGRIYIQEIKKGLVFIYVKKLK